MAHSFSALAVDDSRHDRGKSPLIRHEQDAYLRQRTIGDWLHVADFFPTDFEPLGVVESAETLRIVGQDQEYQILKPVELPGGGSEPFCSRWLRAKQEVLDNSQSGKGIYLGLRVLTWVAEEPFWMELVTPAELIRADVAAYEHGSDVAIILKRFDSKKTLGQIAQRSRKLGRPRIERVAQALSSFHQRARHHAATKFLDDPDSVFAFHHHCRVRKLRRFFVGFGSYLDPFSRLALGEIIAFLERFFSQNESLLYQRAQHGFVVDCHGTMSAENVLFNRAQGSNGVLLIGRKPDLSGVRIADVLDDLASLIIDLEVRGHGELASCLQTKYFDFNQEVFDAELLRFHCVFRAVEAARKVFEGKDLEDSEVDATKYLTLAFKYAMDITSPFLVCIADSARGCGREIALGLSQMLEVEVLEESSVQGQIPLYVEPKRNVLDKLLSRVEDKLAENRSLILVWRFNAEEEAYDVSKKACDFGVPLLFVDPQAAGSVYRGSISLLSRMEQVVEFDGYLSHLPLEVALPMPELALHVIQQMRGSERSSEFPVV
jgi:aminoglycoside phosphotransferase family enzyme